MSSLIDRNWFVMDKGKQVAIVAKNCVACMKLDGWRITPSTDAHGYGTFKEAQGMAQGRAKTLRKEYVTLAVS